MKKGFLYPLLIFVIVSCSDSNSVALEEKPSAEDAKKFLAEYERKAQEEGPIISSASWISSNFISHDSQVVIADYSKRFTLQALEDARVAASFDSLNLEPSDRRALDLIKNGFVMPPPLNEELAGELSTIMSELEAAYGTGRHCFSEDECYDLEGFEAIIDNSRNADELLKAWSGWREIGKPMKEKYLRMVEIGNQGAQDLGYEGLSDLWFSKYDMPAEQFAVDIDQVYEDIRPLY